MDSLNVELFSDRNLKQYPRGKLFFSPRHLQKEALMHRAARSLLYAALAGLWLPSGLGLAQQRLAYVENDQFEAVDLVAGSLEIILLDLDIDKGIVEFEALNQSAEPITAWQIRVITIFEDGRRIWEDLLGDYIYIADMQRPDLLPKYQASNSLFWPQQRRHFVRTLGRNPDANVAKVQVIARGVALRDSGMLGAPSATAYIRDRRLGELKALNGWISRIANARAATSLSDTLLTLKKEANASKSDFGAINAAQRDGVAAAMSTISADLDRLASKEPSLAKWSLDSFESNLSRQRERLKASLRLAHN